MGVGIAIGLLSGINNKSRCAARSRLRGRDLRYSSIGICGITRQRGGGVQSDDISLSVGPLPLILDDWLVGVEILIYIYTIFSI